METRQVLKQEKYYDISVTFVEHQQDNNVNQHVLPMSAYEGDETKRAPESKQALPSWWDLSSDSDSAEHLVLQDIESQPYNKQVSVYNEIKRYRQQKRRAQMTQASGALAQTAQSRREREQNELVTQEVQSLKTTYEQRTEQLSQRLERCKFLVFETSKYAAFMYDKFGKNDMPTLRKAREAKLRCRAQDQYEKTAFDMNRLRNRQRGISICRVDRGKEQPMDLKKNLNIEENFKAISLKAPAWSFKESGRTVESCREREGNPGPGKYDIRDFRNNFKTLLDTRAEDVEFK